MPRIGRPPRQRHKPCLKYYTQRYKMRIRRQNETEDERQLRIARSKEYYIARRARETPEVRALRLQNTREKQAYRRRQIEKRKIKRLNPGQITSTPCTTKQRSASDYNLNSYNKDSSPTFILQPASSPMVNGSEKSFSLGETENILVHKPEMQNNLVISAVAQIKHGNDLHQMTNLSTTSGPKETWSSSNHRRNILIVLKPVRQPNKPVQIVEHRTSSVYTDSTIKPLPQSATRPEPSQNKKTCMITQPIEESSGWTLSELPNISMTRGQSEMTTQTGEDSIVKEPNVYFGGESSKVYGVPTENKSNNKEVLLELRKKKQLLEIVMFTLERKKLLAEKTKRMLKMSILSLQKMLKSEDDSSLPNSSSVVTNPCTTRGAIDSANSNIDLGISIPLHSVHEQVQPVLSSQTGYNRKGQTQTQIAIGSDQLKILDYIQEIPGTGSNSKSVKILRVFKVARGNNICSDQIATKTKDESLTTKDQPKRVVLDNSKQSNFKVVENNVHILSSRDGTRIKSSGAKGNAHCSANISAFLQPKPYPVITPTSNDTDHQGFVSDQLEMRQHPPCSQETLSPSTEYSNLYDDTDAFSSSTAIVDNSSRWHVDQDMSFVKSEYDIIKTEEHLFQHDVGDSNTNFKSFGTGAFTDFSEIGKTEDVNESFVVKQERYDDAFTDFSEIGKTEGVSESFVVKEERYDDPREMTSSEDGISS